MGELGKWEGVGRQANPAALVALTGQGFWGESPCEPRPGGLGQQTWYSGKAPPGPARLGVGGAHDSTGCVHLVAASSPSERGSVSPSQDAWCPQAQ